MWIVEDLEWAIDMVDLVWRYTKLKKSWTNYKALCPFPWHSEKTPSFMVSPTKQIGYCFGCHRGGWAIKFIMDIENCTFKEAVEILSNYTWIKVAWNFKTENFEVKKNLYSLYKDATNYYKNTLKNYPEIKKYLYERGLNEDIINNFNIWYSDSWIELFNYLKSKWYTDEQIFESQIFLDIKTKKDKFIGRVIFPIQNSRWDFVAFAWRITWTWEPKYLNSPASKLYDKSNILYNLFNARQAITKEDGCNCFKQMRVFKFCCSFWNSSHWKTFNFNKKTYKKNLSLFWLRLSLTKSNRTKSRKNEKWRIWSKNNKNFLRERSRWNYFFRKRFFSIYKKCFNSDLIFYKKIKI